MAGILLVTQPIPAGGEKAMRDHMIDEGHTVAEHTSDVPLPSDLSAYDLIIMAESFPAADAANVPAYRDTDLPVLCYARRYTVEMLLAGTTTARQVNVDISIFAGAHPLKADLSGDVPAYTIERFPQVPQDGFASPIIEVAHWPTNTSRKIIFAYEADVLGAGRGARVYNGLLSQQFEFWTPETIALHDAAVDWLVGAPAGTKLDTPSVTVDSVTNPTTIGGTDGTAEISWGAVTDADTYRVELAVGPGEYSIIEESHIGTSITLTGLAAGSYTVAVTAKPAV